MIFGFSIPVVYMTILIVIGICTVLYLLFADLGGGVEGLPFLDPAVILSFISITTAIGYILEKFTSIASFIVFILALIVATVVTALLYYFLLVPLGSAEVSLVYTEKSLEGQVAKTIVPVPLNGFGEIVIETVNGVIAKRAASYHQVEIPYDTQVLIIEVRDGTAYVAIYKNNSIF